MGPFIRGKIRRVLNKTRTVPFIRACLILDEMCRLYGKFASYLRRVLCKVSYFCSYKWPYYVIMLLYTNVSSQSCSHMFLPFCSSAIKRTIPCSGSTSGHSISFIYPTADKRIIPLDELSVGRLVRLWVSPPGIQQMKNITTIAMAIITEHFSISSCALFFSAGWSLT